MTTPQQSLPSGGQNREARAMLEIAHTDVSRGTVRLLVGFFLLAIAIVPLAEIVYARTHEGGGIAIAADGLSAAAREVWDVWKVGEVEPVGQGGQVEPIEAVPNGRALWTRIVAANGALLAGLSGFESALEDESLIARTLRPPVQLAMTGWLGAGNERVYPGRDGWLFYRPDVEYLTGPPFLDPAQLTRRVKEAPVSAPVPQPDPVKAIVSLHATLTQRGVTLIVMPTPQKPAVHPEKLVNPKSGTETAVGNPSFRALVERLEREGVLVFEPLAAIASAPSAGPRYLATDTHWRPETMEAVAGALARFIVDRVNLSPVDDPGYRTEHSEAQNVGDTARMLDLPERASLFPAETVSLTRVLHADGSPWRSSRTADVLVLGDSFSNIYSLESMGWGTSAGFVEQLSHQLRRPVDRLVQNDEGAFATRAMLARSPERLASTRVVVYQFAERELAFGDWKLFE
jgi:hypothetical protein